MLLCLNNSLLSLQTAMDELICHILDGCKLARDLEASLPKTANHPHVLLHQCQEIVATFNRAIHGLSPQDPSVHDAHLALGETPARSHLDIGIGLRSEGESSSLQTINLLQAGAMSEDRPVKIPVQPPENMMALQQWGLDTLPTSGVVMVGFEPGSRYSGTAGTDVEAPPGRVRHPPASAEGPGSGRRPETESSAQRPSRKRKGSEENTLRVPASLAGNPENPPDDGYTWRKYGQKDILGCKFPRSYFRCTHRNYGCEARKQVQRLDEDPHTYEVTYRGTHRCRTSPTPILIPTPPPTNTNPQGEALMPESTQPPMFLSTSIHLGSWSRDLDSSQRGVLQTVGGSSGADIGSSQGQGGTDTDYPVTVLADAMFNSGGSSSSMDAIFSSKQENWREDKDA